MLQNKIPELLREFGGDMNTALAETEKFLAGHGQKTWCSGAALAVVHITPKVSFGRRFWGSCSYVF